MPGIVRLCVVAAVMGLVVASLAESQSLTPVSTTIPSARTSAMGGPHAALAEGFASLFNNPAGYESAPPQIEVSDIGIQLSGPIFDIAGVVAQGAGGNISSILSSPNVQTLLQSIYAVMGLTGPISFAYVGHGLGFGIFNTSRISMNNPVPFTVGLSMGEQLLLVGGYAFRIPLPASLDSTLDAGINMKGVLQGTSYVEKSLADFPTLFSSPNSSIFLDSPFYFDTAIGLDAGLRYTYHGVLSVGLVGRNLYTPDLESEYSTLQGFLNGTATPTKTNTVIPLDLSVGVLYTPKIRFLGQNLSDLKLMVDYNDALGFLTHPTTAKNPLLNIGIGSEITLLRILDLRAGFYQGLFSAGFGVNLKYVEIDTAMFGNELSTQPGVAPVFNILLGISFRL